jgi:MFS family permease
MHSRANASTLIVVSEPVKAPSGDEAVMLGESAKHTTGEAAGESAAPEGSVDAGAPRKRSALSHGIRSVLTGPGLHSFRLLLATRLTGQFADGAFQVALASYVVFSPEKQATAGEVAQAFAALLLPFTIVGPFAGVFLDRWDRRLVIVWANLLRAVLVVGVIICLGAGLGNGPFYVGALAVLSANRFILAGLSASLPHTVPAEHLVTANALAPTAGTLVATTGGTVGLIMNTLVGTGQKSTIGVLACVAALYCVASLVALAIPSALLGPSGVPGDGVWAAVRSVARGVAQAARHVAQRPKAGRALVAISVSRFCYAVVTIMTLLLFRNYFNSPTDTNKGLAGFAVAVGLSGAGFGVSAIITPIVTRRLRLETWMSLCLIGAAATEVVFGAPFKQVPLLVGAFLLGVVSQGQKICTDTLVQRHVEDEFRGRVFVFYDIVYNASFVVAAAFAAAALPVSGVSYPVLGIVAACYAAVGAWFWIKSAQRPGAGLPPPATPAAPPTTPAMR